MKHSVSDFVNAGCELATNPIMFAHIFQLTQGNPCPGCGHENSCDCRRTVCQAIPALPAQNTKPTNKELAEKLGISKRQVSKMRKAGLK